MSLVPVTVTVVGPPAALGQAPTGNIDGIAGESAGDLTITVTDEAGNPVAGADVTWTGDGSVVGGAVTDGDGNAQEETTWFRVSAWGRQAETCNQYLRRGSKVLVGTFPIHNNNYDLIIRLPTKALWILFRSFFPCHVGAH